MITRGKLVDANVPSANKAKNKENALQLNSQLIQKSDS